MDRAAVFVDAGYLFAAGSRLIAGVKLPRGEINLDSDAILSLFRDLVRDLTGLPLLRIYWYDGTSTGPTPPQLALAYKPDVKLRLGFVNQQGEQKGVDSLIVTDLIDLARNRAMSDALLLTGDEDIRVGVQQAQEYGVRVHLLGVEPSRENQSGFLVQEADSVHELSSESIRTFLRRNPSSVTSAWLEPPRAQGADQFTENDPASLRDVAVRIARELGPDEVNAVLAESDAGSVPYHVDRKLLAAGTRATGEHRLSPEQKRALREAFLEACRGATNKSAGS